MIAIRPFFSWAYVTRFPEVILEMTTRDGDYGVRLRCGTEFRFRRLMLVVDLALFFGVSYEAHPGVEIPSVAYYCDDIVRLCGTTLDAAQSIANLLTKPGVSIQETAAPSREPGR
jgi:hypothetical protein